MNCFKKQTKSGAVKLLAAVFAVCFVFSLSLGACVSAAGRVPAHELINDGASGSVTGGEQTAQGDITDNNLGAAEDSDGFNYTGLIVALIIAAAVVLLVILLVPKKDGANGQ